MKKIEVLGIFDSGLGGYSILKALKEALPDLSMVLYADQKNAPYGNHSYDEILELTKKGMQFFYDKGIRDVLLACNTASVVLDDLRPLFKEMRIWGIVDMTLSQIADRNLVAGVVGTKATIESRIYDRYSDQPLKSVAIPNLAGAIENLADKDVLEGYIEAAIKNLGAIDLLVLGCTHYPLVKDIFEQFFDGVVLDSIHPVISFVAENYLPTLGMIRIYTTLDADHLKHQIMTLFNEAIDVEVGL